MKMIKNLRIRLASILVLSVLALFGVLPAIEPAQAQSKGAVPGEALGLTLIYGVSFVTAMRVTHK